MRRHNSRWSLVMAVALAVAAATAPAGQAATTVETTAFSGPTAQVNYWKSTGCTVVYGSNTASTGRARLTREPTRFVNVYMFLSMGDFCSGTVRNYSCYTDSGSVNVSRNLSGATVDATLTCVDLDTGETKCQVSKHEELQGYGDISSERFVSRRQYGSYTYITRFQGTFRFANVTSASISGCGIDLTTQDVHGSAYLRWDSSGFIQILRT